MLCKGEPGLLQRRPQACNVRADWLSFIIPALKVIWNVWYFCSSLSADFSVYKRLSSHFCDVTVFYCVGYFLCNAPLLDECFDSFIPWHQEFTTWFLCACILKYPVWILRHWSLCISRVLTRWIIEIFVCIFNRILWNVSTLVNIYRVNVLLGFVKLIYKHFLWHEESLFMHQLFCISYWYSFIDRMANWPCCIWYLHKAVITFRGEQRAKK